MLSERCMKADDSLEDFVTTLFDNVDDEIYLSKKLSDNAVLFYNSEIVTPENGFTKNQGMYVFEREPGRIKISSFEGEDKINNFISLHNSSLSDEDINSLKSYGHYFNIHLPSYLRNNSNPTRNHQALLHFLQEMVDNNKEKELTLAVYDSNKNRYVLYSNDLS